VPITCLSLGYNIYIWSENIK